MHLAHIDFSGFRSCHSTTVWFKHDLTVLIGENNAGKSNVVDAIRLITTTADGRRTRYCEIADVNTDTDESSFTLSAVYKGLSLAEQALMVTASMGIGTKAISHQLRFDLPVAGNRRGRTSWTVGANKSLEPEPAARDRIRHVYLPPLRDAEASLNSGSSDRIEFVMRTLAEGDEVEELEALAASAFANLGNHALIQRMDTAVSQELGTVTAGSIPHGSKLGFADPVLRQLARALRMKLGEHGVDPTDLASSGLGYANLLFLATVVVELSATRDADLTVFLVEEPEAHLHPQLQVAVLDFLRGALDRDEVPGAVQVIITTHSPQLASAVPSEHLQILKRAQHTSGDTAARQTRAVPIWALALDPQDRRKVDRYLDATRSAMLFGPRVMLVEGIAEALLVPSIARRILDDDEFARFRGSTLVAIDGVDFAPYVKVLLSCHDDACIADQVVVVTDEDPEAPGDRTAALESLATSLGSEMRLQIATATNTLEAALYEAGNGSPIKAAFLDQRPKSTHVWDEYVESVNPAARASGVVDMIRDKRVLKGDLAQSIAAFVDNVDQPFTTPDYLEAAIRAIVKVRET